MDTSTDRRTRRERRRRIQAVGGTCAVVLAVALVFASCASTTRAAAPRPRRLAMQRVAVVQTLPTTTTTTRPAVNPLTGPPPTASGTGRRIVYCNSCQTVWVVEADDYVTAMYKVSGHPGMPSPGEYHVFRKLEMGRSKAHPNLRLPWFVGFAWGSTTDIGFHGIPLHPDGSQIEDDSQLGQALSSGCVRENQSYAHFLYNWAPEGTLVVVTG
jgi:hypothetical protein